MNLVYDRKSLNVIPKTTEQKLIVGIGISEAEVTNNKRLCFSVLEVLQC